MPGGRYVTVEGVSRGLGRGGDESQGAELCWLKLPRLVEKENKRKLRVRDSRSQLPGRNLSQGKPAP